MLQIEENLALQILYTFVLRTEILTTFRPKMVTITMHKTKVLQLCKFCKLLYTLVLCTKILTTFRPKVVTITVRKTEVLQLCKFCIILYTFVLRTEIVTTFRPKVVTITVRKTRTTHQKDLKMSKCIYDDCSLLRVQNIHVNTSI